MIGTYQYPQTLPGLTMVELILYIFIASGLAVVLGTTANLLQFTNARSQAVLATTQHANSATDLITYMLGQADTVVTPTFGNSSNTLELIVDGSTVEIYQLGSQLFINEGGTISELTSNIYTANNLLFENKAVNNYDSIRATFDLSAIIINNGAQQTYTFNAYAAQTLY